jgi:hypothetical protein
MNTSDNDILNNIYDMFSGQAREPYPTPLDELFQAASGMPNDILLALTGLLRTVDWMKEEDVLPY